MPIRFRCVYCNQLLGISRRKAGTIVRCTSCAGQLIVPEPVEIDAGANDGHGEADAAPAPANAPAPVSSPDVFAASEFDAFLEPLGQAGPMVASPPAPLVQRSVAPLQAPALVLSRNAVFVAVVAAIVALGLAFAGGLAAGLWLH
jgi:hypothetical protein